MSVTFNEKVHAHLIGLFYRNLKETHGEAGVAAFVKATQKMAEQRGARMALRVMRDGYPLNFKSYMAYGEWNSTFPRRGEECGVYPDRRAKSFLCAWRDAFAEMGLAECGMVYCKEIDRGIVRGYNPDLVFELKSYLHNSDCCDMIFKDAKLGEDVPVNEKGKMPWDYHCGHVYKTYRENVLMIFTDGQQIMEKVDQQIVQDYDQRTLENLRYYLDTDFNAI